MAFTQTTILIQHESQNSCAEPMSTILVVSLGTTASGQVLRVASVYDSVSNAENASCTGTPTLEMVVKATGSMLLSDSAGSYTINKTYFSTDDELELIKIFVNIIKNIGVGWSAFILTPGNRGLAY